MTAETAETAETAVPQTALSPRFPALDTMRAVGAVAVLTTHAAFWAGNYTGHGTWGTLLARMDVGVSIFFVLSGFLLSRTYLARASLGMSSPALGSYFWKRFLRIFPVYAVTVVICFTFIDDNRGASALQWVKTLLLANVYVDTSLPAGLTQMWSLAVEVAFYLVLPVLMLLAIGRRRRLRPGRVVTLLLVLTGISVWWYLDLAATAPGSGLPLQWLPAFLSWFAVGIGLALAHVRVSTGQPGGRALNALQALARHPGSCWAMAGGLLLVSATPLAGPTMLVAATPTQSLTKSLLYAAIGGLLILPGIFPVAGSTYLRVMSSGPLRHLGLISYGIFCIHLPVLHLVMWLTDYPLFTGHGAQIWLLTFVLSVLAAELIYRAVERPSMRLRRRGIRGRSSSSISKAPATETSTR